MPAALPIIGGVIAGAGAIGAAAISSKATKKAATAAAAAQKEATDSSLQIAQIQEKLFRDIHKDSTEIHQPYLNSGYGAQAVVNQLLGLKPLTKQQFNDGEWYTPGKVEYNTTQAPAAPATSAAPQAPGLISGFRGGTFNLDGSQATPVERQAAAAIQAGADPVAVHARLAMSRSIGGQRQHDL